ncbi:hypothetical protein ACOSQ3_016969 [Xanthoceras sorbifolium]
MVDRGDEKSKRYQKRKFPPKKRMWIPLLLIQLELLMEAETLLAGLIVAVLVKVRQPVATLPWKAVFGHMRKHKVGKERERGALPPPVFSPLCEASQERGCESDVVLSAHDEADQEDLQEQLVSTLLDLGQEVLFSSSSSSSSKANDLDIDMNQTPNQNSYDGEKKDGSYLTSLPRQRMTDDENADG